MDCLLEWLKTYQQIITLISTFISLGALIAVVVIYCRSSKAAEKERKIIGKEKVLRAFFATLGTIASAKVICSVNPSSLWPEFVFVMLDAVYALEKCQELRKVSNDNVKEWVGIESLEKLRDIDAEVRKYYGMGAPKELNKDYKND